MLTSVQHKRRAAGAPNTSAAGAPNTSAADAPRTDGAGD
jgi:hypothetical protein